MKRKKLSMNQLGTLTVGLMNNLLPKPKKTDLLVDQNSNDAGDGFFIYFSDGYFNQITTKMLDDYENGSYRKSNAEQDWTSLMLAIRSAEIISNVNIDKLTPHFLAN